MKRLAMTGKGRVEVLDRPEPQSGSGQVRVRTELASGKHGTNLAMLESANFQGQRFDPERRIFVPVEGIDGAGSVSRENPYGLGTTGVGIVEEVGEEVTGWAPGERVFGLMDIQEINVVNPDWIWKLGSLDARSVLSIEPAYVGIHAIREAGLRIGDTVVITGLGAIGLIAVQMAAAGGAAQIIAVDPLEPRRRLAEQFGATHTRDPGSGHTDIAVEVHELTGGAGVDISIECSGRYDALQDAIRCVRIAGTVCAVGFYQGPSSGLWLGREFHHNRLNLVVPHGCGWGHPPRDYPRWDRRRAYESIVSLLRRGVLEFTDLIRPTINIDEGPDIYRLMVENPGETIKYAVQFQHWGSVPRF